MTTVAGVAVRRRDASPADPSRSDDVTANHRRSAPWPYAELDRARLVDDGWRPTAVREFVFKVHQRCNLACRYCYVYTGPDQSWRDRPAAMPEGVWRAAIANLGRHVRKHRLDRIRVILHGGEPLLFGADHLGRLAGAVRAELPTTCGVEIGLQTNGALLTADTMTVLRRHRVRVGLSVDGPEATHDRQRVGRNGQGSFNAVRRAAELLRRPENRDSYAGVLCVVDPASDPRAVFGQLVDLEPPVIDLLLPHANWQAPPVRCGQSLTPYADWLIAVFDAWRDCTRPVGVRLFEDIIALVAGWPARSEQVGLSPAAMVVVESDGAIEQVDALKSAYSGAAATDLHVGRDEFDAAGTDLGVVARQIGDRALCVQCRACPVARVCGAGHYAHRYDPRNGFLNPTVYCADMRALIDHIVGFLRARTKAST